MSRRNRSSDASKPNSPCTAGKKEQGVSEDKQDETYGETTRVVDRIKTRLLAGVASDHRIGESGPSSALLGLHKMSEKKLSSVDAR